MPSPNVLVDVGRLLAPVLAVRALEPRLLPALVGEVSVQRVLLAVGAGTIWTGELLVPIAIGVWRSGP